MGTRVQSLAFLLENDTLNTIMNTDIHQPISEPWELLVMSNSKRDMAPCRFYE